eukprot:scaffold20763_cov32-Attheya_sp.AAC.3
MGSARRRSPRQTEEKKTPRKNPIPQKVARKTPTKTAPSTVKKGPNRKRAKQVSNGKHRTQASRSSPSQRTRETSVPVRASKRFARRTRSTVVTENIGVMYARTMCAYQFHFVPGSVTNFWECPCCAYFPLQQKANHSVIFSLGLEPPNQNTHKEVNLHFEQCWQHESHILSDFSGASSSSNSNNDEIEEESDDSSDSTDSDE